MRASAGNGAGATQEIPAVPQNATAALVYLGKFPVSEIGFYSNSSLSAFEIFWLHC
jgi:hypothetical protein